MSIQYQVKPFAEVLEHKPGEHISPYSLINGLYKKLRTLEQVCLESSGLPIIRDIGDGSVYHMLHTDRRRYLTCSYQAGNSVVINAAGIEHKEEGYTTALVTEVRTPMGSAPDSKLLEELTKFYGKKNVLPDRTISPKEPIRVS